MINLYQGARPGSADGKHQRSGRITATSRTASLPGSALEIRLRTVLSRDSRRLRLFCVSGVGDAVWTTAKDRSRA